MTWKARPHILGFLRQTKGAVAVEFAIVGTLFLLLIAGVVDFGHAYYMKQVITSASQEGARYGITYASEYQRRADSPECSQSDYPKLHTHAIAYLNGSCCPAMPIPA